MFLTNYFKYNIICVIKAVMERVAEASALREKIPRLKEFSGKSPVKTAPEPHAMSIADCALR